MFEKGRIYVFDKTLMSDSCNKEIWEDDVHGKIVDVPNAEDARVGIIQYNGQRYYILRRWCRLIAKDKEEDLVAKINKTNNLIELF